MPSRLSTVKLTPLVCSNKKGSPVGHECLGGLFQSRNDLSRAPERHALDACNLPSDIKVSVTFGVAVVATMVISARQRRLEGIFVSASVPLPVSPLRFFP